MSAFDTSIPFSLVYDQPISSDASPNDIPINLSSDIIAIQININPLNPIPVRAGLITRIANTSNLGSAIYEVGEYIPIYNAIINFVNWQYSILPYYSIRYIPYGYQGVYSIRIWSQ